MWGMTMQIQSKQAFTGERRIVNKHILRRLVVQQHGVLLNAPFDGHGRFANLIDQPSQAAGDDTKRQRLGEQPYVLALLGHVPRHSGQRPLQLAECHRPEHDRIAGHIQSARGRRPTSETREAYAFDMQR